MTHQTIIVLDFGSQYTQLIARRLRELSVYSEIWPPDTPAEKIRARNPVGIILSGGPKSVSDAGAPQCDPAVFELGTPVLGICYGMQLMAHALGGRVAPAPQREFGHATVHGRRARARRPRSSRTCRPRSASGRATAISSPRAPAGFAVVATSANAPIAAMADPSARLYALLFHPEVVHTERGLEILRNFAYGVCGCTGDWTMASFVEEATARIRAQVGDGRVVCALSGGVDSTVAALIIHRAIGDQLTCIFVDNGVLRLDEAAQIRQALRAAAAAAACSSTRRRCSSIGSPASPIRRRSGRSSARRSSTCSRREAAKLGQVDFLAQGTLYPDVIESVSIVGQSALIKSHHNVGGLPERMRMQAGRAAARAVQGRSARGRARSSGSTRSSSCGSRFPGPGLAVRILGEVTPARLDLLRRADAIVAEEVKRPAGTRRLWQSFAVLLPVQSVGVMGDERTYEYTVAIRAVESRDGMTADWARLPHELLARISSRIVNEVHGINRVVYDISSKPPSTIEWE